jgi:hypothetical protein
MSEEYKSLRSIIFEVQATAAPKPSAPAQTPAKPSRHKPGEVWKTASGRFGAMNKNGEKDYGFDDEKKAKSWAAGTGPSSGVDHSKMDTSQEVPLDKDGNEKNPQPQGAAQPNAGKPATTGKPGAGQPTQKAQAVPANTQYQAQPQGSKKGAEQTQVAADTEQNPDVAAENPKTEYDSEIKVDPEATAKVKAKPDIRKANVVAAAIKAKQFAGPQSTRESVFGKPEEERRFTDEMNHAALSAMRGKAAYDFELCSKVFAQVGFCFDSQTGEKVTKGIPRKSMPQFSSQVDPARTDSAAFKALMAGKGYTSPDQVTPEDLKAEVNMEKQFRDALQKAGYEIKEEEAPVTSLKPIQGELKGEKVAGMYGTLLAAQADPDNYSKAAARLLEPIYVSDGYVIDGHHRWAAQCAIDIANGGGADTTMKTRTITKGGKSVPVDEIVEFSNKFQKEIGLLSQTRGGGTIPEPKKEKPKTEGFGGFGNSRNRLVESLLEAVKIKRDRNPQMGTINYGVDQDDPNRYVDSIKPLKPRKTDARGNLISKPDSKKKSKTVGLDANTAVKLATQLMSEIDSHPVGTAFEIYGTKNGKEYTLKVKKVRKIGVEFYETVSGRVVVLNPAGTGLQVLDKKTRKIVLDRGNDYIWDV